MTNGYAPSVAEWNLAFTPTVTVTGGIDAGDLEDGAITWEKLNPGFVLDGTEVESLAIDDVFMVGDRSADSSAVITVANAMSALFSLGETVASFTELTEDLVTFHNGTAAVTMSAARFHERLIGQAEEITDTIDECLVPVVYDAGGSEGPLVFRSTLENLLPNKATAGDYANPTSITIDAKGRVTEITAGGSGVGRRFAKAGIDLPTTQGGAISPEPHGLGDIPMLVGACLECVEDDAGYVAGEVVPETQFFWQPASDLKPLPLVTAWADSENVYCVSAYNVGYVAIKAGGGGSSITYSKWKLRIFAST